jgi:hypothetical protein
MPSPAQPLLRMRRSGRSQTRRSSAKNLSPVSSTHFRTSQFPIVSRATSKPRAKQGSRCAANISARRFRLAATLVGGNDPRQSLCSSPFATPMPPQRSLRRPLRRDLIVAQRDAGAYRPGPGAGNADASLALNSLKPSGGKPPACAAFAHQPRRSIRAGDAPRAGIFQPRRPPNVWERSPTRSLYSAYALHRHRTGKQTEQGRRVFYATAAAMLHFERDFADCAR